MFLTGIDEIDEASNLLEEHNTDRSLKVLRLFGEASLEEQVAALCPPGVGERKVVLATNVAETSLTIEGITAVVDCGFAKVALAGVGRRIYL